MYDLAAVLKLLLKLDSRLPLAMRSMVARRQVGCTMTL